MSFLGGVESSNGSFWTCLGKNHWFTGDNVGQTFFLLILLHITKEPAQPYNLMTGLQSWSASILKSISCPHHPPPLLSTRDTTLLIQLLRFSILFGKKLQAATSTGSGLKGMK